MMESREMKKKQSKNRPNQKVTRKGPHPKKTNNSKWAYIIPLKPLMMAG